MNFRLLALALTLITIASARSLSRSFELIAYGIGSSYIKLFYSDGTSETFPLQWNYWVAG